MSLGPSADSEAWVEKGWAALPPSYRIPEKPPSLAEARAYCARLARSHYENFHVATWLLPRRLRPHFCALYAYCRISDDLGDEVKDPQAALALLDVWEGELNACYAGSARHPVFVALAETIRACSIPREPFADLLTAFRRDQSVHRYASIQEVLGYCRYSANPVGRLVLHACGLADEQRFRWSDATCSALQIANFLQDVGRDYALGRIYLPQDDMRRAGATEAMIADRRATPEFRALMRQQVSFTRALFTVGRQLIRTVPFTLAVDVDLFTRGGEAILAAIEGQDYDVLTRRPEIGGRKKALLLLQAIGARFVP
ncbi:MAG TPA: squalene synthase HpnC [Opitutaceae bacterium]|jgi:squalene synthase HpnC|nr:squalene synthase HpnC [Opitutaceae bacterium]